jgi:NAD(P) transhydrogenase
MIDIDPSNLHAVSAYLGSFIGGMTFTGSIAAFIKLSGYKFKFDIPLKNLINKPLVFSNILAISAMILY